MLFHFLAAKVTNYFVLKVHSNYHGVVARLASDYPIQIQIPALRLSTSTYVL